MPNLIYITEDDDNIRELIKMALTSFSYEAIAFNNAEDTIEAARERLPMLFIFDIMLPGMDGVSAVKQLRYDKGFKDIPILFITAKDTEMDIVNGLNAGADDYLTKPFGVMELVARVKALLRRNNEPISLSSLSMAGIKLDNSTREVSKDGQKIDLTYKEFELLYMLMRDSGKVIAREELLNTIWGYDFTGETRTLDVHIRSLRSKLGDDAENPKYIKTIRSVGYRFC